MYDDLLPDLCCPGCRAALALRAPRRDRAGEIVGGELACAGCGSSFPLREGVPDFIGRPRPASVAALSNELPATAWLYERAWRPFALTLLSREAFPYGRELARIVAWADAAQGGLLVDVACSTGLYARALARGLRAPGHVAGVDQAMPMLVEARRRARAAGLRISYLRATAAALPLRAGAAAAVAIGGSLNEIGDLDGCLADTRRVLESGGRCVSMTLLRADTAGGRAVQAALRPGGIAFWTPEELLGHFARHRLRPERHERHGIVLFARCVTED